MTERLDGAPFYFGVPKNLVENLIYREIVLEMAEESEEFQQRLWIASNRDLLFFVNTFLWVFEPREATVFPFITWPFQDRTFLLLDHAIGREDFGMEKSRDMGASWMFLTAFFYRWLFKPKQAFGLVSRTEDAVDKTDDPDCLMWKLDFHWERLPSWMRPERHRIKLSMRNMVNGSVITGYSATGDVARGGRKLAFGMDELASWQVDEGFAAWASTQHVTNSRIAVSTPCGLVGIFPEQMRNKSAKMLKLSVHWAEHPHKQRGLYRSTDGMLEIIDTEYRYPPDYPFILDGKLRSPWYDEECRRHPVPAFIARELDIDYGGSGFPFFNASMVEEHIRVYGCNPFKRGELDFDPEDAYTPSWRESERGHLLLWLNLTSSDEPPHNVDYVIGCDICTGVGGENSTNSVASVVNKLTGEKVAEFCINDLYPDKFADYVIAMRKWFRGPAGDAFLIWEMNGPGLQFGRHIMRHSSHRIYYREAGEESIVRRKLSKNPGWHSGKAQKRALLGEYGKAVERGHFINRSIPALDEMLHYIHNDDGTITHDRAKVTMDPTAAGENHGDRVIADAVAWRAVGQVAPLKKREDAEPVEIPYGSMAWRMKQNERQKEESWI